MHHVMLDLETLGHNSQSVIIAIEAAVEAKLIDDPVMEVHRGTLNFPGAEPVSVEFECRKGATREEKDLAFLESLAQIGTIDYAAIGEIQHGS